MISHHLSGLFFICTMLTILTHTLCGDLHRYRGQRGLVKQSFILNISTDAAAASLQTILEDSEANHQLGST